MGLRLVLKISRNKLRQQSFKMSVKSYHPLPYMKSFRGIPVHFSNLLPDSKYSGFVHWGLD